MSDKKYWDVDEEDKHWTCNSCHAHFTTPKQDEDGIMVCPTCKTDQIDLN